MNQEFCSQGSRRGHGRGQEWISCFVPTMEPGYCRPGLSSEFILPDRCFYSQEWARITVTIEQLDEAKVLILDLLGWGVSPEYLIDAGISKECLVPCLRELKLRLPTNIDPSEVAVYDPLKESSAPTVMKRISVSPKALAYRLANQNDATMEDSPLPPTSPSKRKRKSMVEQRMDNVFTDAGVSEANTMTVEEQAASLLERLLPPVSAEEEDVQMSAKPLNAKGRRKTSNPGGGEMTAGFVETPARPLKALKKLARAASASKGAHAMMPEGQGGEVRIVPLTRSKNQI